MTDHWVRPDYDIMLGAHLRRLRKEFKFKEKGLARLIGTSKRFVYDVENGHAYAPSKYLIDLCVLLEVELFELLKDVGMSYRQRRNPTGTLPEYPDDQRVLDGIALYMGVPDWCLPCGPVIVKCDTPYIRPKTAPVPQQTDNVLTEQRQVGPDSQTST